MTLALEINMTYGDILDQGPPDIHAMPCQLYKLSNCRMWELDRGRIRNTVVLAVHVHLSYLTVLVPSQGKPKVSKLCCLLISQGTQYHAFEY